ncbi:MBL fold metallo-hydrolase [Paenilisteria rocourtiae]|uniref:Glyoxylase-like metal-dependent hydrolase (Beta-lactamase superfamily II) n=1 Tax=Listeria rocourtiae TaxID=647910 RepID=A0A4R6ZM96_9LIST|nr:MBL fold metallo-hydrolase [Listeria rocourtiae]TDR53498.1 glyoxylase-like metal-dependent hydrolase (beta-lactamase superfamily II) [Listeria rocourtiae]
MDTLRVGEIKIHWLRGGVTHFDGGAMFGVVPKALWSKKYQPNEKNQIRCVTDPMYFEYQGKHYLIDAGIGIGRLTEKQKRNFGVVEESFILEDLALLGVQPKDIDGVLMTHLHFDHIVGLTNTDGQSIFENATIYTTETEWQEICRPNIRSKATYWADNWQGIASQIQTYSNSLRLNDAIQLEKTGGHSNGHAIIRMESQGESAIHMADIFPTHAHQNVLWVTAYDDYPMDSIFAKERLRGELEGTGMWLLFYHDCFYRALQFDEDGNVAGKVIVRR